ncbi:uncharacterized protein isoform X2 [Rhodnius prolixus]|uniref:uncharacterized protein isoform X2 n=1 Tax=Rhodnius prolixus TaxID=13249 RepID=UPI003D18AF4C
MYCAMLLLELLLFNGLLCAESDLILTNFNWTETKEKVQESNQDVSSDLNSGSLSICDITENYCDVNCCNDKDCTSFDIRSFNCTTDEAQNVFNPFNYDQLYCYNKLPIYLKHSSVALCFEHQNSPYLGRFFKEDNVILSKHELFELMKNRRKIYKFFKELNNDFQQNGKNQQNYLSREFILKIFNEKGYFNEYVQPTNIMGIGYCSSVTPLKVIDRKSHCLLSLSIEQCNKQATQLQFIYEYFKGKFSLLTDLEENSNNTGISMKIVCKDSGSTFVKLFDVITLKYLIYEIKERKTVPCRENLTTYYNEKSEICENLIIAQTLKFIWNDTGPVGLDIDIILADIPLSLDKFMDITDETESPTSLYVSQSFAIEHKLISKQHKKMNSTRGYSIGNYLKLSNISYPENFNCSSSNDLKCSTKDEIYTVWAEGEDSWKYVNQPKRASEDLHQLKHLSVGVGADCQKEKPTEFGIDMLTRCSFQEDSCDKVQTKIKEALLKLVVSIEGIEDGLGALVPRISNNEDNAVEEEEEDLEAVEVNMTKPCEVVKHLQFQILYVPLLYAKSRYRIIGFHSRAEEGVCNLDQKPNCDLFWSVLFRRAEPKSDASRWTLYMTSRIGESYSWYNIFKNGPLTSYHNHESLTFKLLVTAFILLVILRRYY